MSIAGDPYNVDGLLGGDLELSRGRELNDSGNADRLVDIHGARIRSVPGIGWHVWTDNVRWAKDESHELMRLARNTVETINQQADEEPEGDWKDRLKKHAKNSGQAHKLKAMLEVAEADARIVVAADELDSHPYALNTPTGIVNLRDGTLKAHEPQELHTHITRAGYHPESKTPVFDAFLDRITDGSAERREFLQRLFGHALIGEVLEHRLPILQGDGANGKSTLVNAVSHALGAYAHNAHADLLMAGRRGVESATPTVAGLRGKRLVTVTETGEDARLAVERVKAVTGGDMVTGRFLNKNPITFPPSHTIMLMTNNRPRVQEDSAAIWRRLLLVVFDISIPEHEQDRNLERKLRAEQDGILTWAVAGAIDYLRGGLRPPPDVLAETEQYRDSENTFSAWLGECTEKAPADYGEKASELLHSFNAWAKDNRAQPLTKMSLAERLKRAGFELKKRNSANYYLGIRLPQSDSGQIGFPDEEQKSGDRGDVCREIPIRAHAHAQDQQSANVPTISTESAPETTQLLTLDDEEEARLNAEIEHLEGVAATGKIQHALPEFDEPPLLIAPEALAAHDLAVPELEDDASYTTERWQRDHEGLRIEGDS